MSACIYTIHAATAFPCPVCICGTHLLQMAVRADARRIGLRSIRKAAIQRQLDYELLPQERKEAAQALARSR